MPSSFNPFGEKHEPERIIVKLSEATSSQLKQHCEETHNEFGNKAWYGDVEEVYGVQYRSKLQSEDKTMIVLIKY